MVPVTDVSASELFARLNQASLAPPSCQELDEYLPEGPTPFYITTPAAQIFNAFLAPLEEEVTLLGRGGRNEEGEEEAPPELDVLEEAVLQRLMEIKEEANPLSNENSLPYLVAVYGALRNNRDERLGRGLFYVATDDEKIWPWPLVQACASWLLSALMDEEEPDDELTDDE